MQTLASPGVLDQTLARIASLRPDDTARWGRMNVNQMLCHLCDSAKGALGEIELSPMSLGLPKRLIQWIALDVPLRWMKNIPTLPQLDQFRGGTPPIAFESDREMLVTLTRRLTQANLDDRSHPFLGPMKQKDWMRWAWLHTDHHLRQFGR